MEAQARQRKIEVFSAGCRGCEEAIALVRKVACRSCDVQVIDVREEKSYERAKSYGIARFPAIVIDGKLAACCTQSAVDEETLRSLGLGVAIEHSR